MLPLAPARVLLTLALLALLLLEEVVATVRPVPSRSWPSGERGRPGPSLILSAFQHSTPIVSTTSLFREGIDDLWRSSSTLILSLRLLDSLSLSYRF